jgi:hypothetical protein
VRTGRGRIFPNAADLEMRSTTDFDILLQEC